MCYLSLTSSFRYGTCLQFISLAGNRIYLFSLFNLHQLLSLQTFHQKAVVNAARRIFGLLAKGFR
jgi:hypothetical protein